MELGLSLGSEASNPLGLMEKPREVITKEGSLGFCMDTTNSPDIKLEEPHEESSQQQEEVQGKESVNIKDKGSDHSNENEATRESGKEMGHNHHNKSCPIQLDLLPNTPVLRRNLNNNSFLSCHPLHGNRNSEVVECSIKLENIGRGLDMKRVQPKVVFDLDLTNHQHHRAGEEAVAINDEDVPSSPQNSGVSSMLQMDFSLFNNVNKFGGNNIVNEGDHDDDDNYKHCERKASSRASEEEDEDEKRVCARKKLRLSKEQSAFLEESFKEHSTLNPKQKLALAKQLNLRSRQVEVWFQNRRARTKLKQTEVDCEYLKRCCETLTEENRRLHKELQELRALKHSNPFYKQLPATTLTMCPSCEKIATTTSTNVNNNNNNSVFDPISKTTELQLVRTRFYPFSQT